MSTKPRQSQNPNPGQKPGRQFDRPMHAGPWEDRTAEILRNAPPTPPAPAPKAHKFKPKPKKKR